MLVFIHNQNIDIFYHCINDGRVFLILAEAADCYAVSAMASDLLTSGNSAIATVLEGLSKTYILNIRIV
jgi:hypothetical protein